LADALFSRTQQSVLGLIFGQPDRSFFASEIIRAVGAGSGSVQRELAKLEESGLASVRHVGNQKHYQANPDSPVFAELASIAQKTIGLAEPLRQALAPLAPKIVAAFIFGSIAKRTDGARSDIDLLVISDQLAYPDLFEALEPAAEKLGRPINPTVHTKKDWLLRVKAGNAFANRVAQQPKIWIIGGEHDLAS
jgi:predicted nucleotidyltransferase